MQHFILTITSVLNPIPRLEALACYIQAIFELYSTTIQVDVSSWPELGFFRPIQKLKASNLRSIQVKKLVI